MIKGILTYLIMDSVLIKVFSHERPGKVLEMFLMIMTVASLARTLEVKTIMFLSRIIFGGQSEGC